MEDSCAFVLGTCEEIVIGNGHSNGLLCLLFSDFIIDCCLSALIPPSLFVNDLSVGRYKLYTYTKIAWYTHKSL